MLPIVAHDVQEKLRSLVQESFALRERSSSLLEQAKRAVEIAIEEGEETAIDWLSKTTTQKQAGKEESVVRGLYG